MSNVVRLAVENNQAQRNACTDCKHFHPDTASFDVEGWKFLWFGPGVRPTSNAMRFAVCSAVGGAFAAPTRSQVCQGKLWEPHKERMNG